jgi:hypothetical protein
MAVGMALIALLNPNVHTIVVAERVPEVTLQRVTETILFLATEIFVTVTITLEIVMELSEHFAKAPRIAIT